MKNKNIIALLLGLAIVAASGSSAWAVNESTASETVGQVRLLFEGTGSETLSFNVTPDLAAFTYSPSKVIRVYVRSNTIWRLKIKGAAFISGKPVGDIEFSENNSTWTPLSTTYQNATSTSGGPTATNATTEIPVYIRMKVNWTDSTTTSHNNTIYLTLERI